MSNFTEESTAEEIVNLLDEFIPCLDEDRQFIRKYRSDFIYHYNNNFCNLALFSFHYLYMFIINTSMVKYYAFNENIIRNQTGNRCNRGLELFFYFGSQPEKRVIHNNVISEENRELHQTNVSERDKIAHSSGNIVPKNRLISYINNCFIVIEELQKNVIKKCYTADDIQKKYLKYDNEIIESLFTDNICSIEELILDYMKDFYLSYKDLNFMSHLFTEPNTIIFFSKFFIKNDDGTIFLDWDISNNLHKAIYDDFCSKYEPSNKEDNIDNLSKVEILNLLEITYKNVDKGIIYNILRKLIDESPYWVPFGSQKLEEFVNV